MAARKMCPWCARFNPGYQACRWCSKPITVNVRGEVLRVLPKEAK